MRSRNQYLFSNWSQPVLLNISEGIVVTSAMMDNPTGGMLHTEHRLGCISSTVNDKIIISLLYDIHVCVGSTKSYTCMPLFTMLVIGTWFRWWPSSVCLCLVWCYWSTLAGCLSHSHHGMLSPIMLSSENKTCESVEMFRSSRVCLPYKQMCIAISNCAHMLTLIMSMICMKMTSQPMQQDLRNPLNCLAMW